MSVKNERRKEQRAKRRAGGLCSECDQPAMPFLSRCEKHHKLHKDHMQSEEYKIKQKEKVKQRKADRIAKGLCTNCLNPALPGLLMCAEHNATHKQNQRKKLEKLEAAGKLKEHRSILAGLRKELTAKRKAEGLCVTCGEPAVVGYTRCQEHRDKHHAIEVKKRSSRLEAGLCIMCGEKPHVADGQQCDVCLLKRTAANLWGSKSRWHDLLEIMERQQYICVHTGRRLTIGGNASIDHIVPKSKGGSDEVANLQWVDLAANCFKLNQLDEDVRRLAFEITLKHYDDFLRFKEGVA